MNKKYLFLLGTFFFVVVVFLSLYFLYEKRVSEDISEKEVKNESDVIVKTGDIYQKISIPGGEVKQVSPLERGDYVGFEGLPGKSDAAFYKNIFVIKSEDENMIVLKSSSDQQEFKCQIAEKKCERSDIFSQNYKVNNLDLDLNSVFWLSWNSGDGLVYGVESNDVNLGVLNVCDTKSRECKILRDFNFPSGVINKEVNKVVAIKQNDIANERTGEKWELFVYALKDLQNPIKSYDISKMITREEDLLYDGVNSVVWSNTGDDLFLGTTRGIFNLSLKNGEIKEIFRDISESEDDIYWNSDSLKISKDGNYLIFIDTIEVLEEDEGETEESGWDNILKLIDLSDNKVSELIQAKDLSLE